MSKGKCPHGAVCVDRFGYFSDCPVKTAAQGELAAQSGEAPAQQLQAKIRLALERIKVAALELDMSTIFSVVNETYAELSAVQ